jgi:AraC family transcriptional regulator
MRSHHKQCRNESGVDHRTLSEIGRAFEALFGWLGARGLIAPDMRMAGLFYDDPSSVPEEKLRSRACVIVGKPPVEAPACDGIAGAAMVLRHEGLADMGGLSVALWHLAAAVRAVPTADREEYLNNPRIRADRLLSDICLPLAWGAGQSGAMKQENPDREISVVAAHG